MNDIHAQARQGIKHLVRRQVFLQVLTFGGGVILARVLEPAHFGLYAIATFLVALFALFGDFGLAPSFIQRKEELTERDLRVGFTLQQILTTLVVIVLVAGAPWLAALYPKAPPETVWLVRALAFRLYLSAWRSMSALQLERQLRYERLAWIEVAEILSYQGVAVGMAVAGYGVWSFVWATLAQGLVGTTLVYLAAPWRIGLCFDVGTARSVLCYGIPFQSQILINSVGGWVGPVLVGAWIGPQAVGFLNWASSNGRKPLVLVDSVMRVAFPHFARLQDDRAEVERILTRYLTYLLLATGLWFVVLLVAGPSLVRWIYTDKWMPAVPALVLFAAALGFDVTGWVVAIALNSSGRVNFTTQIVVLRTVGQIALSIPLVLLLGFNGLPIGFLAASFLSIPWIFKGLGPGAAGRVLAPAAWLIVPVISGVLAGGLATRIPLPLAPHALLVTAAAGAVYLGAAWLTAPAWLKRAVAQRLTGQGTREASLRAAAVVKEGTP